MDRDPHPWAAGSRAYLAKVPAAARFALRLHDQCSTFRSTWRILKELRDCPEASTSLGWSLSSASGQSPRLKRGDQVAGNVLRQAALYRRRPPDGRHDESSCRRGLTGLGGFRAL